MDIRERIRLIRKDQGLKQKDFGEKLGVTDAAISRIESGQRGVTDQMKKSICTLFNINLEWLEHESGRRPDSYLRGGLFLPDRLFRVVCQGDGCDVLYGGPDADSGWFIAFCRPCFCAAP